ncbi:unnamed protein product [Phytomonas sp. Hart1]|nr:unnamed protein product [Phytomonas sp. Hart1]|eukprot:CCW70257.1 unnamed protein product [Phytomonas sp. isolate Hart1]
MAGVVVDKLTISVRTDDSRLPDVSSKVGILPSEDLNSNFYRLSNHFVPVRYELEFQPDVSNHRFRANEIIQIEVCGACASEAGRKESSPRELRQCRLVLHGIELVIRREDVFIVLEDDKILQCISVVDHPETSETLEFYFDEVLPQETGQRFAFHIDYYEGLIHTGLVSQGLFYSSSSDPGFLATHLEPTNARKLFPCFDEPSFKAVFKLSVVVDPSFMVVSNMPLVHEENICAWLAPSRSKGASHLLSSTGCVEKCHPSGGELSRRNDCVQRTSSSSVLMDVQTSVYFRRFVFEETPPMHTCILGFNVGKFSILEWYCSRLGIRYRVVFPCNQPASSARYALDLLNMAVNFFNSFFNFRIGLKKLDVVALECFQSLGMENWGMINILMEYLLVKDSTPVERRQRIARLVGHEVCHHWFGNRLSIEWWNDIWLKEGLCRLLEYHFVDACFPDWGIWDDFIGTAANASLDEDAVAARTHPLRYCDGRPRRVSTGFDAISYGKGAALLRLLFALLGLPALKRATARLLHADARAHLGRFKRALLEGGGGHSAVVVERVLRLAERAGHPYLLIRRGGPGAYRLSQYAMPTLRRGVLPEWVRRGALGGLSALPTDTTFVWDPTRLLRRQPNGEPFVFPMVVLEASRGARTVYELFVDHNEAEYRVHDGKGRTDTVSPTNDFGDYELCYFNYGATGLLRCDHDLALWRQIFKFAAFLHSEDHITITATLSSLRNVLVGRFPYEPDGDRCTLMLEWLSILTTSTKKMSSFLWDFITTYLEKFVYLVQGQECSHAVYNFVKGLYDPLLRQNLITFFATEDPLNFKVHRHISCTTVNKVLGVLVLCGSSFLMEEAAEMGFSVLAALGQRSLVESMSSISPASARGRRGVNFMNSAHVQSATIALFYLALYDPSRWWGCIAGIVAGFCSLDTVFLEQNIHLCIPKIVIESHKIMEVLPVVLPAFFSMVDDRAFDFMANVLNIFSNVPDMVMRSLLWNTRFLVYLLSHCNLTLKPLVMDNLAFHAAKLCSNSHVIALLYAYFTRQNSNISESSLFQALLLSEEEEAAAMVREGEAGNHLSPNMLESFSAMTVNCVWIAYCRTHIEQFLRKRLDQGA